MGNVAIKAILELVQHGVILAADYDEWHAVTFNPKSGFKAWLIEENSRIWPRGEFPVDGELSQEDAAKVAHRILEELRPQ